MLATKKKRKIVLICYIMALLIGWYFHHKGELNHPAIMQLLANHPIFAPFIFCLVYTLSVIFLIPTLPLNLGAGMLFGPWWGSILATLGSTLGAMLAFQIARNSAGTPLAQHFDNKWLDWLQQKLISHPWKVVAFVRLNPLFPTGPINFIFGMTSISFANYSWPTLIFFFPASFVIAVIGYFISQNILTHYPNKMIDVMFILFTGFILLYFSAPLLKKTFTKLKPRATT